MISISCYFPEDEFNLFGFHYFGWVRFTSIRGYYKSTSVAKLSIPLRAVSLICCWPFMLFFLLSLSRRGQYCFAESSHPEFWTMTMNLRSSGSALLIMWFVSLRAESDYYSEKWKGFLVTDMCVQVLCKKTSRNSFSVFWEEATNYEKLFMGSIFNINFIKVVMFPCVFVNLGTLHLKNCLEIPKCTKINKYACFMVHGEKIKYDFKYDENTFTKNKS